MAGSSWLTIDRLIGDHRLHAIVVYTASLFPNFSHPPELGVELTSAVFDILV